VAIGAYGLPFDVARFTVQLAAPRGWIELSRMVAATGAAITAAGGADTTGAVSGPFGRVYNSVPNAVWPAPCAAPCGRTFPAAL